jgi:diaminopimelate epimerase
MSGKLPFTKMHGAGNDFIMLDGRILPGGWLSAGRINRLCDRRRGVGADGLMVIGPDRDADFAMAYYNADGGEAEMCGNGARCAVAFARRLGLAGDACTFLTASGPVRGTTEEGEIAIALPPPRDVRLGIDPGSGSPFSEYHFANTGVPHLVVPVPDVGAVDVGRWGPVLRHAAGLGPAGANVDWVEGQGPDQPLRLRTYERGVEAETLACGTGAAATALVMWRLGRARSPVALLTRGGDRLTVTIETGEDRVALRLRGPVVVAFEGEVPGDV